MTLEEALRTVLVGDAGVSALVGTRVYPLVIPNGASYPAIAYQTIGREMSQTQSGAISPEDARIQLTCVCTSYAGAKSLMEAIRNAVDGKDISGMTVFVESVRDDYAESGKAYVQRIDLKILYKE